MPDPSLATDPARSLLVPFAGVLDPAARALFARLPLPHLSQLLTLMHPAPGPDGAEWSFTPPHERARAEIMGLHGDDGSLPWAALASTDARRPQAWFHPVHFQVGMDQVSLLPASWLDDARSREMCDALAPLCREDGVELTFESAGRWRAEGERLRGLSCASLDRVAGRSVAPWQPRGPESSWLRRLQSEAQMLFYTHPANDRLEAQGLAPVNGFWPDSPGAVNPADVLLPPPRTVDTLRAAALQGDWPHWAQAWEALDAGELAQALESVRRGEPLHIVLCGERRALRLVPRPRSWFGRWTRRLRRTEHPASLLESS